MQCQKLKTYMETGRVVFLPPKAIVPNPAQPRKLFREEQLEELTQSIRRHGILQPLSVRRGEAGYELIAGERRLRAGIRAGLAEIPCIIMHMDDTESALVALVENLQRQELNFVEQARGISRLLQQFGLSQEQTAGMLGISQSAVANKLRLLRHDPKVLTALVESGLTERHGRALLRLPEEQRLGALHAMARQNMNVARAEQYIESMLAKEKPAGKPNLSRFLAGLDHSLAGFRLSGIPAVSERRETDRQIVVTITIPKPQ